MESVPLFHYRTKMPEMPYVSEEAWDFVGRESVRVSDPVSMRHLKEYLAGADDWNPLYCDDDFARRTHYGGIVAPPLFFLVASRRVVPMSRLLEDGQYDDLMVPGVHGVSVLAGWDIELGKSIRIGDVITVREKILSIDEKQGRTGKLVIVKKESTHTNQRGEHVARDVQTIIYR
jgi:acyl dehydratase